MIKKVLYGSLLAACCSLAHADNQAPERWNFSWQGFFSYASGEFRPDVEYHGTFGGVDANHNGDIELNELTELLIDGRNFATCKDDLPSRCGVSDFSFKQNKQLAFTAGYTQVWGNPGEPDWSAYQVMYQAGELVNYTSYAQQHREEWGYFFTPETVVTITPIANVTPVPEPETYAMLGLGLLLLAGVQKKRKQQ